MAGIQIVFFLLLDKRACKGLVDEIDYKELFFCVLRSGGAALHAMRVWENGYLRGDLFFEYHLEFCQHLILLADPPEHLFLDFFIEVEDRQQRDEDTEINDDNLPEIDVEIDINRSENDDCCNDLLFVSAYRVERYHGNEWENYAKYKLLLHQLQLALWLIFRVIFRVHVKIKNHRADAHKRIEPLHAEEDLLLPAPLGLHDIDHDGHNHCENNV